MGNWRVWWAMWGMLGGLGATAWAQHDCVTQARQLADPAPRREALTLCLQQAARQHDAATILTAAAALADMADGEVVRQLGYWLEAERYLRAETPTDARRLALRRIAELYQREGFAERALEYYRSAWRLLPAAAAGSDEWELLLLSQAQQRQALGQVDSADIAYRQLLEHYAERGQPDRQAALWEPLASLHQEAGQYARARVYYQQWADWARAQNQPADLAAALNNLGYAYHHESDYALAAQYFRQALAVSSYLPRAERLNLYHNLAVCSFNRNDPRQALFYLDAARSSLADTPLEQARLDHLSAAIYLAQGDYLSALRYFSSAQRLAQTDQALLAEVYLTGAKIHEARYELTQALEYYQRHLRIMEALQAEASLRRRQLSQQLVQLERAEREIQLLLANQEVQTLAIQQLQTEKARLQLAADNLTLESARRENDLLLLQQQRELGAVRLQNEQLVSQRTRSELALSEERLRAALADRALGELSQREAIQRLQMEESERESARQIEILNRDKAISALELSRQRGFQRFAYALGAALLLILALIAWGWQLARRNNRLLVRTNREVEAERLKSEQLLLNILPEETARELKETGRTAPRRYAEASVLFTDFVNFTALASTMHPEELLAELNECFVYFDEIVEREGLEKIKIIGDSYLCVAGLPTPMPQHAHAAITAARAMQDFIENRYRQRQAEGKPYWRMRIGIHSGPVVAGVVGKQKFSYDIWGDTVNTASRMEGASEPGRINISEATYAQVQGQLPCVFRGELEVKGKGSLGMYFVEV